MLYLSGGLVLYRSGALVLHFSGDLVLCLSGGLVLHLSGDLVLCLSGGLVNLCWSGYLKRPSRDPSYQQCIAPHGD